MFDSHSFRLDGHVALVTGSAAGIGLAIAEMFASAGAAVMVSDVDLTAAEKAAARIAKAGGNTAAIACDVTSEEDLERVVDAPQAEFGGITLLVSNAGGGGPKPFDMPMRDFRRAFDLNIFSLFRLAQLAAPVIEESGGGAMLVISATNTLTTSASVPIMPMVWGAGFDPTTKP
ncbi:SDR family NAD(P)-dependent oxidoreductase [Tsuneonella flava]|uniref:SDR family NAD(P)-dependent oxidoreductase n=1 Tax=Tsuneonella flava TaxID=2055955 RepID=A0ABX7KFV0_9SPHN|nr:SDR family NAD(P)-dependent oxidoreductase [Tsuneonella flava]